MKYDKARVEYLLQQPKTEEVVEELIRRNKPLIDAQLYKFYFTNDPDAISYAYEALYKAIMTWDATKSMFSTYATVCIYNALGMHLRNMRTLIHTNTTFYEQRINGTQLTYADILESNEKAEDNVMIENGLSDIYRLTEECLEALTNPLHRLVVETWANSNFEKTQIILAKELDISQTYVCRILKKFRNTLKEKLEAC